MNDSLETQPPFEKFEPASSDISVQRLFPVWSGWDVLLLFLFTFFITLFVGAFADAVSHLLQVKFPSLQLLRHPASQGVFLLFFQAFLDGLLLMFIYFTITLKYNSPFLPSIKWVPRRNTHVLIYLLIGVFLAFMVLSISALFPSPTKPPIEELLRYPITAFLFAALGILVAPFVEEVVFRGFIYPVVERKYGRVSAVVATALLFTTVHVSQLWGSWTGIVLILLVGLTLSATRAKTDSLIPSFIIHLSYNSTICLLFLIGSIVKGFPA